LVEPRLHHGYHVLHRDLLPALWMTDGMSIQIGNFKFAIQNRPLCSP